MFQQFEKDLLYSARVATDIAIAQKNPVSMRKLAQELHEMEQRIHGVLISLQGKLNGKAFGK